MSLSDAGHSLNPDAEAALTRLVGPELLGECDLLIPTVAPQASGQPAQHEMDEASGTSYDASASPNRVLRSGTSANSPNIAKRQRDERDNLESEGSESRSQGTWFSTLTAGIFGSNKRRKRDEK